MKTNSARFLLQSLPPNQPASLLPKLLDSSNSQENKAAEAASGHQQLLNNAAPKDGLHRIQSCWTAALHVDQQLQNLDSFHSNCSTRWQQPRKREHACLLPIPNRPACSKTRTAAWARGFGQEVLDRISVQIEMQHTFISKPSRIPILDSSF